MDTKSKVMRVARIKPLWRVGDVVTDGQTAKVVTDPAAWHSDMSMDEVQGAPCSPPFALVAFDFGTASA